jgi:2-phosphosulfolactate phosphatase
LENKIKFHHYSLEDCGNISGLVVVIDVLRAFSTAAYAFAAGVEGIYLVSTVEQAFSMQEEVSDSLIMGEVNGLPVEGFDFGNSPNQFDGINLSGKYLIQRTTSGTQGAVCSRSAETLLTTSFCNAMATANFIDRISPAEVTFVITGLRPGGWGDEDQACADYIQASINKDQADKADYLRRVCESKPGQLFLNPDLSQFPREDLEYSTAINKFNFIMQVQRKGEHLLMEAFDL